VRDEGEIVFAFSLLKNIAQIVPSDWTVAAAIHKDKIPNQQLYAANVELAQAISPATRSQFFLRDLTSVDMHSAHFLIHQTK
jgi:hypothetical protein